MGSQGILKIILMGFVFAAVGQYATAETYHVNARTGSDANPGTSEKPIKTFTRMAELVNGSEAPGPTIVKVAPGVYTLTGPILFANHRGYTRDERLTIEAEVLPDDAQWKPEAMPIILSNEIPAELGRTDEIIESSGLKIEIEHVTIRGLKFLGSPVPGIWYYPIFREGKNLDDLLVTQCLFVMDKHSMTSNVAILANGHGLVVDHCVFFGCRNPVVFWRAEGGTSHGNVMRYCIVEGAFTSGIWVCDTGEDLEFHHNIITRSLYAWMRDGDNSRKYKIRDSVIAGNEHFSGKWAEGKRSPTGKDITFDQENVVTTGTVELVTGDGIDKKLPRNWLHVVKGSPGSELGAGLFHKTAAEQSQGTKNGGEESDS